jgi:hypothetical protein
VVRTPSRAEDDIDLLYRLAPNGWGELVVLVGDDVHRLEVSHVFSDPVADLMALCVALLKGADSHTVRLPNEPGEALIEIARHADQRHIVAVKLIDCNDVGEQSLVAAFDIKARQLVELLYHQFAKLAALCREQRYRAARDSFPEAEFQNLTKLREES